MDKKPIGLHAFRVFNALRKSWGADTAYHKDRINWSTNNPAAGQCAVTALVVNRFFGGKIIGGISDDGVTHFWNRILGVPIDLTQCQFAGKKRFRHKKKWSPSDLLLTGDVAERYKILLNRAVDKINA